MKFSAHDNVILKPGPREAFVLLVEERALETSYFLPTVLTPIELPLRSADKPKSFFNSEGQHLLITSSTGVYSIVTPLEKKVGKHSGMRSLTAPGRLGGSLFV